MPRYNWDALKREFLLGDYKSLRQFAKAKKLCYSHLRRKAVGWAKEKSELQAQKERKIAEGLIQNQIKQEIDWNITHLKLWGEFLNILQEVFKNAESVKTKDGRINAYVLEKFANVMEKAQKGQRIALGLDNQNEAGNDSLKELVEAIRESAKECEQQ